MSDCATANLFEPIRTSSNLFEPLRLTLFSTPAPLFAAAALSGAILVRRGRATSAPMARRACVTQPTRLRSSAVLMRICAMCEHVSAFLPALPLAISQPLAICVLRTGRRAHGLPATSLVCKINLNRPVSRTPPCSSHVCVYLHVRPHVRFIAPAGRHTSTTLAITHIHTHTHTRPATRNTIDVGTTAALHARAPSCRRPLCRFAVLVTHSEACYAILVRC